VTHFDTRWSIVNVVPSPTRRWPLFSAVTVAATGVLVLFGWLFNIESLMSVVPGLVRMKPNTAVAFLFAAAALYCAHRGGQRLLQASCIGIVFILGAASLWEDLHGTNLGIDQLLFRDPIPSPHPGRMALFSAVPFVITAAFLFPFRFRKSERVSDSMALVVAAGSAFAVVGYLYGVPVLYGSIRYTAMAIHTGIAFIILALGFLFIEKQHGFGRIFRAQTSGGAVARQMVPLAFFIPILVGLAFLRFNFGQLRLALVVMSNAVSIVIAVWGLARALDRSEIKRGAAQLDSEMDALTAIHNRRYLETRLAEEVHRCLRHGRTASLLLFDVDHFKTVNDRFGHPIGDQVLKTVAGVCQGIIRTTDILCRFGGEEFAVIAPETTGTAALVLAAKLRNAVADLGADQVPVPVTISLGVAEIGDAHNTPEKAIAAADEALYRAKNTGRNRECLAGGEAESTIPKQEHQYS
jgi:diguanylate cyclase (GGDEF)-like protein